MAFMSYRWSFEIDGNIFENPISQKTVTVYFKTGLMVAGDIEVYIESNTLLNTYHYYKVLVMFSLRAYNPHVVHEFDYNFAHLDAFCSKIRQNTHAKSKILL